MLQKITPGAILLHQFLEPLHMTPADFAQKAKITEATVDGVLKGRKITRKTAEKMGAFLDTSTDFWLKLQKSYDNAEKRHKAYQAKEKIIEILSDIKKEYPEEFGVQVNIWINMLDNCNLVDCVPIILRVTNEMIQISEELQNKLVALDNEHQLNQQEREKFNHKISKFKQSQNQILS